MISVALYEEFGVCLFIYFIYSLLAVIEEKWHALIQLGHVWVCLRKNTEEWNFKLLAQILIFFKSA